MTNLPEVFLTRMREILGEEFDAFIQSYEETRKYGLRLNGLKTSPEDFEAVSNFHLSPIGWIPGAYYYLQEDGAARHPFYAAGLYYLQEPSAMTPASVLDIESGMKVLDTCAAPGGKSTALGAKLQGQGLLVANDISASRCKALLHNIEIFGIPNAVVTNAAPAKLADKFPAFFDRVLVDAPCSGEGMFRKDEATIKAWHPAKPDECAAIQKEIVLQAADMLKPGGKMLYSTCTFAPVEDEEMIRFLLENRPELHLIDVPARDGFAPGLPTDENGKAIYGAAAASAVPVSDPGKDTTKCVRLWPHKTGGEGHFLALIEKDGDAFFDNASAASSAAEMAGAGETETAVYEESDRKAKKKDKKKGKGKGGRGGAGSDSGKFASTSNAGPDKVQRAVLENFFADVKKEIDFSRMQVRSGQVYYDTGFVSDLSGIPFLRNGLYLGEVKKDRFEPGQSFAMTLGASDYSCVLHLSQDDERCAKYLRGETLEITEEDGIADNAGWCLVCVESYPMGWGKVTGKILKNKLHPGWRSKY